ncbi:MAG: Spy0128 family protein [Enterocloster sp.]
MMKKICKGAISILLTVALSLPVFSMAACAEEVPVVEVPVTIGITSSYQPTEDYRVVLTAVDADCPMPEGSTDGTYTGTVSGAGTNTLCRIACPKLGIYHYTIHQEQGTNSRGTYDNTVYKMTVSVTNAANGGLETTTIVYVNNVNDKSGSASFSNSYSSSSNSHSGSSGGGSSSGGRASINTNITETAPPLGLVDPITEIADIPLAALPQTGTLWWLVPILALAGVMMFAVGFYRVRRSNDEEEF